MSLTKDNIAHTHWTHTHNQSFSLFVKGKPPEQECIIITVGNYVTTRWARSQAQWLGGGSELSAALGKNHINPIK